ncbi:S1C family serine protease [uncultured Jatrophihabitans sp.]|uniref:S1C family serine protease n=1 Tax=uncultured Jatrophihabitans sp. TaxID=1610747 RepID=UPI0035CA1A7F
MTDDAHRPQQPDQQPQHPDWSGHQPDGTRAWGIPTHAHDPQHTEWVYDRGAQGGYAAGHPGTPTQWGPTYYGAPLAPPAPPQGSGARRRSWYVAAGAALVAAAATAFGFVATGNTGSSVAGSGSLFPSTGGGSASSGTVNPGNGSSGNGSSGNGSSGNGSGSLPGGLPSSGSGTTSASVATDAQQKGIVTIVSVLKYQNAESAGTGMILSSDGEILTNNHVISGATSITVTVETTGKSYTADVVGTDATDDVAVVKLRNASGLTKAKIGDSGTAATGDSIVGVGNAGGTGTLRASAGKITALNRTITASDGNGTAGERLHGLIEINAGIISGDSGGPLYDAKGNVIGMDTAASASSSRAQTTTSAQAYAIPINSAVSLADKIESGVTTSTIVQGVPGFLGVGVADASNGGATITSVLQGGPADKAGIASGSVITSVDGKKTGSADALKSVMGGVKPGTSVQVRWTDSSGATHSASVTPIKGPAA